MREPEIELIGAELDVGETHRATCVRCGRKKTMTVTRLEDGLVWNCYSASCDLVGRTGGRLTVPHIRFDPSVKVRAPFAGPLEPLSEEWETFLRERVGFEKQHLDLARPLYASEEHRIAYPIYGPMGHRRGYVLRTYTEGVEPKTLTKPEGNEPTTSWYRPRPVVPSLLVVEDIPSAVRAARYFPQTLAMNSGGMGKEAAFEAAQFARNIVWAFDQDATLGAIKHHKKYSFFFDSSRVLPLEKDIKDMKEEDLCSMLS